MGDLGIGARSPVRMLLKEIRACQTKHQEWSLRRCANNVLDQIQKDRRCPVNVIEHDDQGTRPTERFEETSRRPRDLFGDEGIISQP